MDTDRITDMKHVLRSQSCDAEPRVKNLGTDKAISFLETEKTCVFLILDSEPTHIIKIVDPSFKEHIIG